MRAALLVAAMVTVTLGSFPAGLRARFDYDTSSYGEDSFMKIPITSSEAETTDGWTLVDRSGCFMPGLLMYCYSPGYFMCGLYENDTYMVAGVRIAVPLDILTETVLDWDTQGFKNWTLTVDDVQTEYYFSEIYFVSEESQNLSPSDRIASRDMTKILSEGFVWITGFYDELMKLSADQDQFVETDSVFTEQACFSAMGLHYYYNMTTETACTASSLLKHFILFDDGELNAVAITMFQNFTVPAGQRIWFETPTELAVKNIVPNGPQCLYDMISAYSGKICHIYFTDAPLNITCTD